MTYNALDIRDDIFRNIQSKRVTASIIVETDGIVAGITAAKNEADKQGLSLLKVLDDGAHVLKGDEVVRFGGSPKQIVMAEDVLIGLLAKTSGIATSAHHFVKATDGRPKVVCGAWKKMPPALKEMIREAVTLGGAACRMEPGPFVYLDKNYVELLGGIKKSLEAVAHLNGSSKVIQVKGRHADIATEAREAAEFGASIVFIDTGNPDDVQPVAEKLLRLGLRNKVKLAFGGGVSIETIGKLKNLDLDILDIGRQIVDAPILDMRLEVIDMKS
ncbi:MAG: quinolinate phosphoribosyl transferase [Desulfomonile tiedjei]|nr:quinolinate phosphoribosyl transferase [Desulfomonile tiedjei]